MKETCINADSNLQWVPLANLLSVTFGKICIMNTNLTLWKAQYQLVWQLKKSARRVASLRLKYR